MTQETAEYKKQLEILVKKLEKKNYVSKVRFDTEFSIYKELLAATDTMVRDVYSLFPHGIVHPPADEKERIKQKNDLFQEACTSLNSSNRKLATNCVFIPKEIYSHFEKIYQLCRLQVNFYPTVIQAQRSQIFHKWNDECYQRSAEIVKDYENLQDKLHDYLQHLDVNN